MSKFLQDDHPYYHSADADESSVYDPMPGGDDFYDEIDEGILESLIIIALAGALVFLVYYRQQRQQTARRVVAVEQQVVQGAVEGVAPAPQPLPGQQPDGGFFPPAGDPNYGQWVAGGIGH